MAIHGGNEDVDEIVRLDDLSLKTLIALVARLKETETGEQFLCREMELDEAYLYADSDFRDAKSENKQKDTQDELELIRTVVCRAHDFVGESNVPAAIQELDKVIDLRGRWLLRDDYGKYINEQR